MSSAHEPSTWKCPCPALLINHFLVSASRSHDHGPWGYIWRRKAGNVAGLCCAARVCVRACPHACMSHAIGQDDKGRMHARVVLPLKPLEREGTVGRSHARLAFCCPRGGGVPHASRHPPRLRACQEQAEGRHAHASRARACPCAGGMHRPGIAGVCSACRACSFSSMPGVRVAGRCTAGGINSLAGAIPQAYTP